MPLPSSIGKRYTFNTLAPAKLGAIVENAKLVSIMNYDSVIKLTNMQSKYSTIHSSLPNGTPTDPKLSVYYVFEKLSGDKEIFSQYWIDEGTVEEIVSVNLQIMVTDVSVSKITLIRDLLLNAGITTFNIDQV